MNIAAQSDKPSTAGTAKIIYILYLAGIAFGITWIIGVVMAYIYRDEAPNWQQSHYRFQIRTFWIGSLYLFVGGMLSFIFVGLFILLFWIIWLIVRCVKGMKYLDRGEAYPDPSGWMF